MVWIWLSFGYVTTYSLGVAGVDYIMWFGLWRSPVLVLQVCLAPGGELSPVNLADG